MAVPREVKVGAFVFAGLVVAGLVVFLIGDERRLFESKVEYYADFGDVQGLKPGSPVRMGGVDIGRVAEVGYGPDPNDVRLHVTLEIVESEARRIRKDSVTSVDNKGLLGDKMVVIQLGSTDEPPIPPGGKLPTEESQDFTQMFERVDVIAQKAELVLDHLEKTTASFANEQFREDLSASVHHLSGILAAIDEGDGYASKVLHDESEAESLSRAIGGLERSAGQLEHLLSGVNATIARVNQGPGFAHDVIYGDGPGETINQFGRAAGEIANTLQAVRDGNGFAHSVIYGDAQSADVMQNLNAMSQDLRQLVADMRAGKGTLGALLVDPSVYEDLKLILGNVDRNKALRALVRYSIQRDEKVAPVEIVDPKPVQIRGSASGGGGGVSRQSRSGEAGTGPRAVSD